MRSLCRAKILVAIAALMIVIIANRSGAVAAEATTGIISGLVSANDGAPVAHANVTAASPSGRAGAVTDARGRFTLIGLNPGTYGVSVEAAGFEPFAESGVVVLPGQLQHASIRLTRALQTIGTVTARTSAFSFGGTSDAFTVTGQGAQVLSPPPTSTSGLANYLAGTAQGAIASVPGVQLDSFGNAILRGGQVDDAVFDYDSVAIPQGLIAEPGGNVVGAQLPTTGIGHTTVTLAGFQTQGENALGAVIDQIPAIGTYPASATLELGNGIAGSRLQRLDFEFLGATPDQRWRYAFASSVGGDSFSYGDGHTFYPSEAGTYGLALQNRSEYSLEANVHYKLGPSDDVALLGLLGEAAYNQYDTPYAGETFGAFDGATTVYPGETDPAATVHFATGIRGTYDIVKGTWLHSGPRSLSRVQLYQSRYGSSAGGPYWDENGFPNGTFSLSQYQGARETGLGYDGEVIGNRHHLRFGVGFRANTSYLHQVVPTFDQVVSSQPTLGNTLVYLGDTWSAGSRLELMGAARWSQTHIIPGRGQSYSVGAVDPHFSGVYRLGNSVALRATYDHTTVAPKPLEADRYDSKNVDRNGNPAPFVALSPETANAFSYSVEGRGATQFRLTYYAQFEKNRIDVLPFNFRQVLAGVTLPSPVGVPTNIGELRAHGVDLWLRRGGFTLDASYVRAFSSSASQFAFNSLNAPAVAAGHLFPVGYVPDLSATVSYELRLARRRVRITPAVSYETGFPYGNGRMAWIFDPATKKPIQVPNDNYVNPGANYYFLRDPSQPFDAATNPYIGNLGTPEGNDPNSLRTPPKTLLNLHIEGDLSKRVTAILDVVNVFANATPTTYQSNPYLIGPPGYAGGDPLYGVAYQHAIDGASPYTLGNGVPTNNGVTQAVPWAYGRAGYVPQGYPMARSVQLRIRYRL